LLDYRDGECSGLEQYLQVWSRLSSAAPWARNQITYLHDGQNWIEIDSVTHFSDWGLVLHAVFLPMVKR
jgi:hypothetical protein